MQTIEFFGLAAAAFTSLGFCPQIIKIWKSQSAQGISTATYLAFGTGFSLWIVYGLYRGAFPVIIANVISLISCIIILGLKWWIQCKKLPPAMNPHRHP